jgi:SAM-dependent methyltransferase
MSPGPASDTWERGSPYEQFIGRWSRTIAPLFVSWLDKPANQRWLDVGCGTGVLSAAVLDRCAPGSLIGVEPSEGFRELAAENLGNRALLLAGDAAALPLDSGTCDVVVSGLVLNFVPDLSKALAEGKHAALRARLEAALAAGVDNTIRLPARAWAVRGATRGDA